MQLFIKKCSSQEAKVREREWGREDSRANMGGALQTCFIVQPMGLSLRSQRDCCSQDSSAEGGARGRIYLLLSTPSDQRFIPWGINSPLLWGTHVSNKPVLMHLKPQWQWEAMYWREEAQGVDSKTRHGQAVPVQCWPWPWQLWEPTQSWESPHPRWGWDDLKQNAFSRKCFRSWRFNSNLQGFLSQVSFTCQVS